MSPSAINTPLDREAVEIDGRRMTPARRARILERDGHCCRYPGCDVKTGLQIDHIIALQLGGRDRDDNLQALCEEHHKQKTRIDAGLIAQAKRRKAKAEGAFPEPAQKLRSRNTLKGRNARFGGGW
jgi:5-methylcytosine-specific restriction endonuclease McrA